VQEAGNVAARENDEKTPDRPRNPVPGHVAIIMDGNGRWAKKRRMPRTAGHVAGISALRRIVAAAHDFGIAYLTVYAFSTENWQRPPAEVSALMGLFRRFFHADMRKLQSENVRVRFIGRRAGLAPDISKMIEEAERMTEANTGLNLTIAFSYGAREELVGAARALARAAIAGQVRPEEISEASFAQYLQTAGFPDVDLVIRPGGEKRVSNFLLWQAAYAEFVFVETLWPDFDRDHLEAALAEYAVRDRRFGGVGADAETADRARTRTTKLRAGSS
jgi:undecaprenyl diphosphate synthase